MMRRICWTVMFVASALLLPSASAEAAWVSCAEPGATTDREFKINTAGATCLPYGTGTANINANGVNARGWISLDKSDDSTSGALQGVLQITGQGTTRGSFTVNPLAWATYSQIVLAFKSGQGDLSPDWSAFILPVNTVSGSWKVSGQQTLAHANLYGSESNPPVPEPATLALLGTGLALSRLVRGKRQSPDNRTIV